MVGAIRLVGGIVHEHDGLGLHFGGAAGVAKRHHRDAVIAPVIGQLLAVLQHNDGHGETGMHCLDGFAQSAQGVQGGSGNDFLGLDNEPNGAGAQRAQLASVEMLLGNGDVVEVLH